MESNDIGGAFLSVIMFVVILAIYFIPFVIASYRRHPNLVPIFLINLFFGWTLIGWVGSLVWSLINLDKGSENEAPVVKNHQVKSGVTSKYQEIERLSDLKDKGVITQQEFDKEKAKLLS